MIYFDTQIELENESFWEDLIRQVVDIALDQENIKEEVEISVLLVDAPRIKELNSQFRNLDKETDVLSFPQEEGDYLWPQAPTGEPRLLGDIVIAMDVAAKQAQEYGHSLTREVAFLTSHGLLHLLGYEHGDDEEDTGLELMLKKQEEVLKAMSLPR